MSPLLSETIVLLSFLLAPLAFIGGWLLRERRVRRGSHALDAQWANELRVHHELRRLGAAPAARALVEPSHPLGMPEGEDETVAGLSRPPWPRPAARPLRAPLPQEPFDVDDAAAPREHESAPPALTWGFDGDDDGLPPLPPPVRLSAGGDEDAHFDATTLASWPDSVRGTTLDPATLRPAPAAPTALTRLMARGVAAALLVGLGWAAGRAIWPVDGERLGDRATRALSSLPGAPEPALAADRPAASSMDRIRAGTQLGLRTGLPQTTVAATPPPSPPTATMAANPKTAPGARGTGDELPPMTFAAPAVPKVPATMPVASVEAAGAPAARATEPPAAPSPALGAEGLVEVRSAQLCASLTTGKEGWRCVPVADSAGQGIFYFYTRLRATRATKVRHVWYRDNEIRRAAELTLAVSGPEGYRTYSRMPIDANDGGTWRVELRDEADRLLHEAQVIVR